MSNRFNALDDDPAQPTAQREAPKQAAQQKPTYAHRPEETAAPAQRQHREPREPREPREDRPRGDRPYRGRGRGGPRPATGGDDQVAGERRERREPRDHHEHRFQGKPREGAHPMDRKDGTGRGRGARKGGYGKGGWDENRPDRKIFKKKDETIEEAIEREEKKEEGADGEEVTKGGEDRGRGRRREENGEEGERRPRGRGGRGRGDRDRGDRAERGEREQRPRRRRSDDMDGFVEPEDDGVAFDDFIKTKKTDSALIVKKEAREHEKVNLKNIADGEKFYKQEKGEFKGSKLNSAQVYNQGTTKSADNQLLAFGAVEDDAYDRSRGGRGGRGRGGDRGKRNKIAVNDDDFPTL